MKNIIKYLFVFFYFIKVIFNQQQTNFNKNTYYSDNEFEMNEKKNNNNEYVDKDSNKINNDNNNNIFQITQPKNTYQRPSNPHINHPRRINIEDIQNIQNNDIENIFIENDNNNNNDENIENNMDNNINNNIDNNINNNICEDTYLKQKDFNEKVDKIISYFNLVCSTKFKSNTSATRKLIKRHLNEGFTIDDFTKVIELKYNDWGKKPVKFSNGQMSNEYLRPATLFGDKFESYVYEALARSSSESLFTSVSSEVDSEMSDLVF